LPGKKVSDYVELDLKPLTELIVTRVCLPVIPPTVTTSRVRVTIAILDDVRRVARCAVSRVTHVSISAVSHVIVLCGGSDRWSDISVQ